MNGELVKKLYVCLDKETEAVFYASMIMDSGSQAEMRTSHEVGKGMLLLMMPVPEEWDGGRITAQLIQENPETVEAQINRTEGRARFNVRIFSRDERELADMVRAGRISNKFLKIETIEAGIITTFKVSGRLVVESVGRLQPVLKSLPEDKKLILLDLTTLSFIAGASVNILYVMLEEAIQQKRLIKILAKPESRVWETIIDSKIQTITTTYTNREEAVAALLQETLI
ncbi:MAG: hypothetical protein C4527_13965 [Candidatus Omnitrophota bacterium]|jgi:hypothetical protein|nr:MAG: hypothetical protein C4527_13965 [Candidatus Omnitrophota bacterium]